jgi:MarR family transcriptional regulator, transcriptional regulator for hemolysin
MDEEFERYAMLLHSAASLWRARLDARLRPWGMTQTTWRTLWLLRAADACYNQSELAARLGIETPTLVGILDRMESKGWLRRVPDEQDRRQKRIEITEAGRDAAREIEGEVLAVRAEMLAGFDAQELQTGARVLERIVERAGARKS